MLPNVEVVDLTRSLWIWRFEHPSLNPDADWQQVVTCLCVNRKNRMAAERMTAFPRDTSDLHGVPDDCRRGNPVENGRNNQ
jgi:hypothetical protein